MHVTLVHVRVKPERIEDFVAASRANHEGSIAEPGNRRFDVLQDPHDPGHFVLYEAYATPEDAAAHKQTAHYAQWRDTVADMMAAPREGVPMVGLFPGLEMIAPFAIARLPRIELGAGRIARLPAIAAGFGRRLLMVTGGRSLRATPQWAALLSALREAGIESEVIRIAGEPSPDEIDAIVQAQATRAFDVVVGIGGGSVLDAAKAIAGLLRPGNSVMDHLEGVGPELPYRGPATPFIAVPTTAGTGSEATKNAVLTRQGPDGFKKSFRDEALVAEYAIIDPDLLATCPPPLIAANGMDALTQLLESYVSARANPITDALAWQGLVAVRDGLLAWYEGGEAAAAGREQMALAALLSGICLAQAGLGSVHGLAQPLGSFFPIPHGVVCGTLVGAATRVNLEAMRERRPDHPALAKYARVGRLFGGARDADEAGAQESLLQTLDAWTRRLALPPLADLGVADHDYQRIVANARGSSMKTNPIELSDAEIERVLRLRFSAPADGAARGG